MPEETEFARKHNEAMAAVAVTNPTAGKFSATQGDVGAELGQLITDTYTAVVTGREPFESFDTMLDDWRSHGIDDIRAELGRSFRRVLMHRLHSTTVITRPAALNRGLLAGSGW